MREEKEEKEDDKTIRNEEPQQKKNIKDDKSKEKEEKKINPSTAEADNEPSDKKSSSDNKEKEATIGSSNVRSSVTFDETYPVVVSNFDSPGASRPHRSVRTFVESEDSSQFVVFQSYATRFWILLIFSLLAWLQVRFNHVLCLTLLRRN